MQASPLAPFSFPAKCGRAHRRLASLRGRAASGVRKKDGAAPRGPAPSERVQLGCSISRMNHLHNRTLGLGNTSSCTAGFFPMQKPNQAVIRF